MTLLLSYEAQLWYRTTAGNGNFRHLGFFSSLPIYNRTSSSKLSISPRCYKLLGMPLTPGQTQVLTYYLREVLWIIFVVIILFELQSSHSIHRHLESFIYPCQDFDRFSRPLLKVLNISRSSLKIIQQCRLPERSRGKPKTPTSLTMTTKTNLHNAEVMRLVKFQKVRLWYILRFRANTPLMLALHHSQYRKYYCDDAGL